MKILSHLVGPEQGGGNVVRIKKAWVPADFADFFPYGLNAAMPVHVSPEVYSGDTKSEA